MCGCEPGFTCSACAGTPRDPAYLDLPEPENDGRTAAGGGIPTTHSQEASP